MHELMALGMAEPEGDCAHVQDKGGDQLKGAFSRTPQGTPDEPKPLGEARQLAW